VKGTVNKDADTGQRSLTIYKVAEIPKGDVNGDLRKSPEDLNTVLCTLLTQQYPEVGCQCPALAKYAPPETSVTMADVKVFYDSFTNNRERLTEVTCGQQGLKIIINVQ
ncbi:MAG: hypothetical protein NZT61_06380, partial [Deltaproteobacteria bacterium]|nr:hypothetical protein [Deltaproteobacteria bacterium]